MSPDLLVCSVSLILLTIFILSPVEAVTPPPVEDVYVGCYKMVDAINMPPENITLKNWMWNYGIKSCHHKYHTTYVGVKTVANRENRRTKKIDVFCVHTLEIQYKLNDSSCKPCKNYTNKICGGSASISVYEIKVEAVTPPPVEDVYVGCYKMVDAINTPSKDIKLMNWLWDSGIKGCHHEYNTTYVGVKTVFNSKNRPTYKTDFFCVNTLDSQYKLNDSSCKPCKNYTIKICGKRRSISVYEIKVKNNIKSRLITKSAKTHLTETTTTVAADVTATVPSDEKTAPVQEAIKEDSTTTNEKTHLTETTTTVAAETIATVPSDEKTAPVQEAIKEDSTTTNEKTHLTETTTTVAAKTIATVPSDEKTAPVQEAIKEDSTTTNEKTHLTETTTTVAAETIATAPSDEKTAPVQEAIKEDSTTTNEKTPLTETTTTVAAETIATAPSDEKTAPVQEAIKEDLTTTNEKTHLTETTTTVVDVKKRTVSSEDMETGLDSETTSDTLVIENETTTPRDHKNETFNGKISTILYHGITTDETNEPNYERPVQVKEITNLTEIENANSMLSMISNSPYNWAPISVICLLCVLWLLSAMLWLSYCLCKPDRVSIDREAFKTGRAW